MVCVIHIVMFIHYIVNTCYFLERFTRDPVKRESPGQQLSYVCIAYVHVYV